MSTSRTIRWVLLVAAMAGLGYFGWHRLHGEDHAAQADNAQKRAPARVAVPVKTAAVEKADFPVYLTGLGSTLLAALGVRCTLLTRVRDSAHHTDRARSPL